MRSTMRRPSAGRRRWPAMPLLEVDGALDRVDRAGELDQRAVAHHLDDAAADVRRSQGSGCRAVAP